MREQKPTPNSILNNIKRGILEEIKQKIDDMDSAEEIYFHDIVSSVIDRNTPTEMKMCSKIIAEFEMDTEHIDEGLIDTSTPKRTMVTTAYVYLENELFKDDFFVEYLQNKLNNEVVTKMESMKLLEEINDYIKENKLSPQTFEDNEVQVHVTIGEELKVSDFFEPFFNKSQVIDLHDGIKIMADNYVTNKNAIVMENLGKTKEGYLYRVYIMDKSKELDMRKLLVKYGIKQTIGRHNNYSFDIRDYRDTPCKNFPDKKEFIYTINKLVNGDEGLIKISDKLHEEKESYESRQEDEHNYDESIKGLK